MTRAGLRLAVAICLALPAFGCGRSSAPHQVTVSGRRIVLPDPTGMVQVKGRDRTLDKYWAHFETPEAPVYAVFLRETTWVAYTERDTLPPGMRIMAYVLAPSAQPNDDELVYQEFRGLCEAKRARLSRDSSATPPLREETDESSSDPARRKGLDFHPLAGTDSVVASFGVDSTALGVITAQGLSFVAKRVLHYENQLVGSAYVFVRGRILILDSLQPTVATEASVAAMRRDLEAWVRATQVANQ